VRSWDVIAVPSSGVLCGPDTPPEPVQPAAFAAIFAG
jgi:hypothetical protein